MAKAIAAYTGGIHNRVEIAVRTDGVTFQRSQFRGRYGYQWTPWKVDGRVDVDNLPHIIEYGFSNLSRAGDPRTCYRAVNWDRWRLPN